MELKCPICGKLEKIDLYANKVIRFACGYEKIETKEDLDELFKKYRGKG